MTISPVKIVAMAFVLVAITLPPLYCGSRLVAARRQLSAAESSLLATMRDVQEIRGLRATSARVAEARRPEQDMVARVHAALAEAGIDVARHFRSLRPESDAPLSGSAGYRRQSVGVALAQLEIPSLGAFLAAWRQANPLWVPTRQEMTRPQGKDDSGRYDVSITFSAIYLAPPASASAPSPESKGSSR